MTLKHHTEETVVDAIHSRLSRAEQCRIAVAYCGEAAYTFFPEKPAQRPNDLRILIDASDASIARGLTNPVGIEHLMGLTNKIRSLADLHAKVWIFDDEAAIVGSVNMSQSSIERQFQLAVEITDKITIKALTDWFEERWEGGKVLRPRDLDRLKKLKPEHPAVPPHSQTRAKIRRWKSRPPRPELQASDVKIGASQREINRLLQGYRTNECGYPDTDGAACSEVAKYNQDYLEGVGRELRSLMRDRSSWRRAHLERLFDIAYTNGRAAQRGKAKFISNKPQQVANALEFLLMGSGDPFIRFEKLLSHSSGYKVIGLGKTGLNFLMYLWRPNEFAIVNGSVKQALKQLKVQYPPTTSDGQELKDYTTAVKQIMERTGLESFSIVDHFLDGIAKGHIT